MAEWVKMTLRVPAAIHEALEAAKVRDGRSINQIIVDSLNTSLGGVYVDEDQANDARIIPRLAALETQADELETLRAQVRALESRIPADLIEKLKRLEGLAEGGAPANWPLGKKHK